MDDLFFLKGDANLDGKVGLLDLDILGQNWQTSPGPRSWSLGDFNHDGAVGLIDLDILGQNWGVSALTLSETSQVTLLDLDSISQASIVYSFHTITNLLCDEKTAIRLF